MGYGSLRDIDKYPKSFFSGGWLLNTKQIKVIKKLEKGLFVLVKFNSFDGNFESLT